MAGRAAGGDAARARTKKAEEASHTHDHSRERNGVQSSGESHGDGESEPILEHHNQRKKRNGGSQWIDPQKVDKPIRP